MEINQDNFEQNTINNINFNKKFLENLSVFMGNFGAFEENFIR